MQFTTTLIELGCHVKQSNSELMEQILDDLSKENPFLAHRLQNLSTKNVGKVLKRGDNDPS